MDDTDGADWFSYRQAAKRVNRSVRTLWRWRKEGMPMLWGTREGQRARVVHESVLLEWYRAKMQAWPVHQAKLRRELADQEEW